MSDHVGEHGSRRRSAAVSLTKNLSGDPDGVETFASAAHALCR